MPRPPERLESCDVDAVEHHLDGVTLQVTGSNLHAASGVVAYWIAGEPEQSQMMTFSDWTFETDQADFILEGLERDTRYEMRAVLYPSPSDDAAVNDTPVTCSGQLYFNTARGVLVTASGDEHVSFTPMSAFVEAHVAAAEWKLLRASDACSRSEWSSAIARVLGDVL